MRVRYEKDGTVFEFERRPLPGPRFRALCLLGAGIIYGAVLVGVAITCGGGGVLTVAGLTAVALLIASA